MRMRIQLALITALPCAALFGCGGGSDQPAMSDVEADVQASLVKQLRDIDPGIRVQGVACVRKGENVEGRCLASLSGSATGSVPIRVTFGDDQDFLWETEAGNLDASVQQLASTGDDASGDETDSASAENSTTNPVEQQVAAARRALEAAGRTVESEDSVAPVAASLQVDGVSVIFYESESDAESEADEIQAVFKERSGRGRVTRTGDRVYYIAQERTLKFKEIETFSDVVTTVDDALK